MIHDPHRSAGLTRAEDVGRERPEAQQAIQQPAEPAESEGSMPRVSLKELDGMKNIAPHIGARSGERRRSKHTKPDKVSEALAACGLPSELGNFAVKAGIPSERVLDIARRAPNWGQFRMVIGNCIRGALARTAKAKTPKIERAGR